MNNLFGTFMDENNALYKSLKKIPGVGKKTAIFACQSLGLIPTIPWKKLTEKQQRALYNWLEENIHEGGPNTTWKNSLGIDISEGINVRPLGTDYIRKKSEARKLLISLGSLRGIRLRRGLPIRGQKTHSNGRTARKRIFLCS